MPSNGSILLGEVAGRLAVLEIVCDRCDRQGRANVDRLLAAHGADTPIPSLLRLLSADCPKRLAGRMHDVCGVHLPQLSGLFGMGDRAAG